MLIKVNEEKTVGLTLPSIMNILSIYYNQNITLELIIKRQTKTVISHGGSNSA